ncbi:MAG: hypothetical protein Q8L81_11925, partial [Bacteroidota bacterium]|nr:hypothetical protein [Bacteroidota bacterium]
MKNKLIVTVFLLLFNAKLPAQNKAIDSLIPLLKTAQGGKKIDILISLSNEYRATSEEKALKYALEAKDLAQKEDNKIKTLEAKIVEAKVYLKHGKDKQGLELSEEALKEAIKLKQNETVAKIYKAQYYYYRDVAVDIKNAILIIDKGIAFTSANNMPQLLGDMY